MDGAAEAAGRFEDGELVFSRVPAGIFKQPDSIGGFVRTGDDQIIIPVPIRIAGHWPRPEADPEIDRETGVVISKAVEGMAGPGRCQEDEDEESLPRQRGRN